MVRLRRLPSGDPGAGRDGPSPAPAAPKAPGCSPACRRCPTPARSWMPRARYSWRRCVRRAAGPGLHRRCGAEGAAEGLPHPAVLHPRAAAGRTALPERTRHRHLGAPQCTKCIGRAAHRQRRGRARSGRRPGDPLGVQLRRTWRHHRRRKSVGTGPRLLLCRRAVAGGDALGGQRPGRGVPGGRHAAADAREPEPRASPARCATRSSRCWPTPARGCRPRSRIRSSGRRSR